MKRVIEYGGAKIKYYLCDNCGKETTSTFCFLVNPLLPNNADNWIELCFDCSRLEGEGK